MRKVEADVYGVDHEELGNYFPMDVVTQGLLDIYQVTGVVMETHSTWVPSFLSLGSNVMKLPSGV